MDSSVTASRKNGQPKSLAKYSGFAHRGRLGDEATALARKIASSGDLARRIDSPRSSVRTNCTVECGEIPALDKKSV